MTEVRIRHVDVAEPVRLGEVPLTDLALDGVIALLKAWGVCADQELTHDVGGQFCVTDGAAYFEIIVGDDE